MMMSRRCRQMWQSWRGVASARKDPTRAWTVSLRPHRDRFAPYRLDNCSRNPLGYYQRNCEEAEEVLGPYSSVVYTWDEPRLPRHQF